MKRRQLFNVLVGCQIAVAQSTMKKFVITGYGDDCKIPPKLAYGYDRIDALTRSGITIWSEEEWASAMQRMKDFNKLNPGCPMFREPEERPLSDRGKVK